MTGPGTSLVVYAFSLGLVAAVNPCGLPMLPAYLALFTGGANGGYGARVARSLLAGGGVTAGFVVVFGAVGVLVSSGVRLVGPWLPWVMVLLAAGMLVGGVLTLAGRAPSLRLPLPGFRPSRSAAAMLAYGVAYALGSLSCSLPLFLAAVGSSFTGGGAWAGSATFLAYALGMGLFITAASVATATIGATAVRRVRPVSRWVPRVSGLVLAGSGAYLLYYWVHDLRDPTGATPALVSRVQVWLTSTVGADPARSALVLGVVVLAGFAVVVRRTLRAPAGDDERGDPTP
ncbi:cytochrome c biogenesis CcdA family protein [Isoptericola sp. b441]|uniref:Cytochrome c biogenesis CcdA family protein n=1 Tax=Actinotalea lenta TaxID=3064654 RepID=A0ABT9DF27_9CELL|nr:MULTISPECIES: cytochrome c biogenesis CcdA family protein [unclassified Isoptericola]MDO8108027.1 cytochrome c biogenesis CcdA family protein [Isoptericola sp. b441]MDO8120303.1 cytochrome c biogenesis CcdA family protein [Isoptericola sp. b490]